jgi:hypothetical protein
VPPTRLQEEPLGRVGGRPAEEAVVTELAGLLDRLAELGSDQAIRALLPRTGADNWAALPTGIAAVNRPRSQTGLTPSAG